MAKKGQKFNNYTKELKEEILQRYFNEKISTGELSREYNIWCRGDHWSSAKNDSMVSGQWSVVSGQWLVNRV